MKHISHEPFEVLVDQLRHVFLAYDPATVSKNEGLRVAYVQTVGRFSENASLAKRGFAAEVASSMKIDGLGAEMPSHALHVHQEATSRCGRAGNSCK